MMGNPESKNIARIDPKTQEQTWTGSIAFHIYTVWLFTASDIISVIVPETLLGISCALSGSLLTTNATPSLLDVIVRVPHVVVWNWMNLLLFDVNNQLQSGSIIEDSVNKPWRAIPSQRLTASQARALLRLIIPSVYLATLYLGGTRESVTLMVMTWMYNDLGGADDNLIIRNILNAFGYMCYSSGSMSIATGYGQHNLNETARWWLCMIGAVIFTTLQMQDMPDVDGDAARSRKTVPLVYGDYIARCSIAVPVMAWSFVCPTFLKANWIGYVASLCVGTVFIFRLFTMRSVIADGTTWKVWCLWMIVLYLLPLCSRMSD